MAPLSPLNYPICPKCGMPMRLALLVPLDEPGQERRRFECVPCKESLNVMAKL